MGQCSTLPSEGRTVSSSRRGEESSSHRHKDRSRKNSFLQVHTQNGATTTNPANSHAGEFSPMHNNHHHHHHPQGHPQQQGRNPDTMSDGPEPMEEDTPMREDIPLPPEIAIRTRCYKLNLDSNMFPPPSVFLGPYMDAVPPLTYTASDDSSANTTPLQVAIRTAKIFRGITVGKDGTILSQNARATRSNRGSKNKRGEKSRQATKIEKAKDLVEETILTGKVRFLLSDLPLCRDCFTRAPKTHLCFYAPPFIPFVRPCTIGTRVGGSGQHAISCNYGRVR